jgi:hypothetical protein
VVIVLCIRRVAVVEDDQSVPGYADRSGDGLYTPGVHGKRAQDDRLKIGFPDAPQDRVEINVVHFSSV